MQSNDTPQRIAHAPAAHDSDSPTDASSGLHDAACCASLFRMLGEAFDPIMREYGVGKIEWSDSRFIMVFGHCSIGVMVSPDHPHLVGIRRQAGLLTPDVVAQTLETEVGLDALRSLATAYREDRMSKLLPIRDVVTFHLDDQRTEDSNLSVSK